MVKKNYIWLLLALVCSLGFTACSDDNDDKGGNDVAGVDERIVEEGGKKGVPEDQLTAEEKYQLDCQKAVVSVMRNLAGVESVTPDVVKTTHKPVYGIEFESELVRAAKCESTTEAEQLFFSLIGLEKENAGRLVTATADGYTANLTDLPILPDGQKFSLGTLTFHRGDGSKNYGSVDVAISCIRPLESIVFISPNALPDNASAAYQVGDVVWVEQSSGYCTGYYVCVTADTYGGTLAHMCKGEAGSDETINLDGDNEGCWVPYNNKHGQSTNFVDCKDYISFLIDDSQLIARVKSYLKSHEAKHQNKVGHVFPEGFDNDNDIAYHSSNNHPAAILFNAVYGDYAFVPPYNYRHSNYALVPQDCKRRGEVTNASFKYIYDRDWDKFCGDKEVYTLNVIHFDDRPINGARLEFSGSEE